MWTAARILSRALKRRRQLRIHIHGQWIFALSRRCHLPDVAPINQGHEDFRRLLVKNIAPSMCIPVPNATQFRRKPIPVRMQIPHEIFWNLPIEEAICFGGMVSPATQDANLVLHLNHQNGLLPHIKFSYVPHQSLKSAGIGVEILLGQSGKNPTDSHPAQSRDQSAWVPSSPSSAHSLRRHSSSCRTTTRQGANAELALARSNDPESQSRTFPRGAQSAPRQPASARC